MPFYHRLGEMPQKRHTQFRKSSGGLYREEVMGLEGFSGIQSILYHHFLPPRVLKVDTLGPVRPEYADFGPLRHRAFATESLSPGGDPVSARRVLMGNADVTLSVARPSESMTYFYRNAQAYEVWFTHEGKGVLRSQFGRLPYQSGDYIVIPYGTTWMMELEGEGRFFVIESATQIEIPPKFRNKFGQINEHAPYSERDFRVPQDLETISERGEFEVRVKVRDEISKHTLDHHPFDVVGWDGYLYPFIFNINDYQPLTGALHKPPPDHLTFRGWNFVVCSFVPRMFDYHPEAIPAPYNHSNVNSDEVIYYCDGDFMSRKGIDRCDITLHPSGIPHGPQPGATEASIGKERTDELAVMVDTFRPLEVALPALEMEKPEYMASWLEGDGE